MRDKIESRFASFNEDGELIALVAEGLPDWPEDITALTDEQVGELHVAYVDEARAMASETTPDPERATELRERIPALRTEAARRFTEAEATAEVPEPETDVTPDTGGDVDVLADLAALVDEPGDEPDELEITSIDPVVVAAATARGVSEGMATALTPLVEQVAAMATALAERPALPAGGARVTARDLASYNRGEALPPSVPAPRGRLIHTGDAPGFQMGQQFTEMSDLVDAFIKRHRDIGVSTGTQDEKVLIASFKPNEPSEARDLRGLEGATDGKELRRRINAVCGPQAIGVDPFNLGRELPIGKGGIIVDDPGVLTASGGLSAPVEPYFGQLLLAEADRPVAGAYPGFIAERGGIRLVLPASLSTLTSATQPGYFTDGVCDNSTAFSSATANFTASDLGQPIVSTGGSTAIPAGTTIATVSSATAVVLSASTTGGSLTGVDFSLPARNPYNLGQAVGVVTAAQDAAGPPSVLKYTYDVPIGSQVEHDVYSIYTSLQFANLTARAFPEQVELNIRLANALAARVADQQALNYITGWSTLLTFAKTFGTARQLLAQFEHLAAYYRNNNRMDPSVVLRLGIPAWAINAMRGDYISTFMGGGADWGLSDEELMSWFADRHILPFLYWDGPSDISQLFATVGSGAINTNGVNNATPVAVPDYPGQGATTSFRTKVVSFMWAEGTWLGLTTGELNLGLVRDSVLNSQNRFRNFEEVWETPAFVGLQSLRTVHTVASDGTYGAAASITLGVGSGL